MDETRRDLHQTRRDIQRARRDLDETARDLDGASGPAADGSDWIVPYAEPAQSGDTTFPGPRDGTTPGSGAGPGDRVTLRFGPGVPPEVAKKWSGAGRRRRLGRRVVGGLLTVGIAVLAGLIVWWLLRGGPGVTVTSVSVSAPTTTQSCDTTVRLVGTIRTNGGYGDVKYRWRRSDGHVSGVLTESVRKGQHSVQVPLRWTVKGDGTLHAVATLEIVQSGGPGAQASAAFDYVCG